MADDWPRERFKPGAGAGKTTGVPNAASATCCRSAESSISRARSSSSFFSISSFGIRGVDAAWPRLYSICISVDSYEDIVLDCLITSTQGRCELLDYSHELLAIVSSVHACSIDYKTYRELSLFGHCVCTPSNKVQALVYGIA